MLAAIEGWTGWRVVEPGLFKAWELEQWCIWLVLMYTTGSCQLLLQGGVLCPQRTELRLQGLQLPAHCRQFGDHDDHGVS